MECPEAAAKDIFSQGARPLARVVSSFKDTRRQALWLFFLEVPTPFTSSNSFLSFPMLYPASQVENTKNRPDDTFIARPLAHVAFGCANIFPEALPLLSPTTPTSFTSANSFRSYPTLSAPRRLLAG